MAATLTTRRSSVACALIAQGLAVALLVTLPACSSRTARPSPTAKVPLPSVTIPELERQRPAIPPSQESRMVGLHVDPDALAGLNDRALAALRQSGTNTLLVTVTKNRSVPFIEDRGSATGVYFKTDWAPVIQDRLSAVVGAAHRQGMQVWASLSVRRMDWVDPQWEWADRALNTQTGRLERVDTLDLLHPAMRDYLVGLLTDLAGAGIDGLFLAADPPSEPHEGFSAHALMQFEKDVGRPMDLSRVRASPGGTDRSLGYAPEFWRWLGWKQREQSKSVLGVLEAVRVAFPGLKTAVEIHPEAVTSPQAALARYAEDLFDLRRYRLDYIAIPVMSASSAKVADLGVKAAAVVPGERLLLLVDPAGQSAIQPATLPAGTGVLYREQSGPRRLTNPGR